MDILQLKDQLEKHGYIATLWHIDDVKGVRPDLTDEQAWEVLEQCDRRHDAEIGITWQVIEIHAADLFPEPREHIV
jgi:hypothetical protein